MNRKEPFHGPWPFPRLKRVAPIREVSQYRKTKTLRLELYAAGRSRKDQNRINAEWCDFFAQPNPVRQLALMTKVSVPLFEAICRNRQLTGLYVMHCKTKDLTPLGQLTGLQRLQLNSLPVEDVTPLAKLKNLEHLAIHGLRARDYSALRHLSRLRYLELTGRFNFRLDNLNFVRRLRKLRGLSIYNTNIIDDTYDRALMNLPELEYLDLHYFDYFDDAARRERILSQLPGLRYGTLVDNDVSLFEYDSCFRYRVRNRL